MQALVEYYSEKGWLQRVEQCILHMDISSLDFNQVIIMLGFFVYCFLIFQEEDSGATKCYTLLHLYFKLQNLDVES